MQAALKPVEMENNTFSYSAKNSIWPLAIFRSISTFYTHTHTQHAYRLLGQKQLHEIRYTPGLKKPLKPF